MVRAAGVCVGGIDEACSNVPRRPHVMMVTLMGNNVPEMRWQ
jgi:hypothetical protein